MRVTSAVERLDVAPGGTGVVPLEVVNTATVIDSLSVQAVGVPAAHVRADPEGLALFPQSAGDVTLTISLPAGFPAGTYPVTFVVAGQAMGARAAYHDVDLVVPAHPHLALVATPSLVRARGQAEFGLQVTNDGNVPVDVALRAVDADRAVRTVISPSTVSVPPGQTTAATVIVKGPRQLLGSDRDRPVQVVAQVAGAEASADLVLRQRSAISQGLLTSLVLLTIVAIWATVFLLGTSRVLGREPDTKVAADSYFVAASDQVVLTAAGTTAAAPPPAGALPKEGPLPAGVGGVLTGTVRGAVDGQGLGRITVVALREGREGLVVVSSAATQADGTYAIAGLFPGEYLVRVDLPGYRPAWFPAARSRAGAQPVAVGAGDPTSGVDLALTGLDATLRGTVDPGDAVGPVDITVTARPTWPDATAAQQQETTVGADGGYSFDALPAPGTYQLTIAAEGYQPTTLTERVLGGQERFALDVRLGAGTGSIGGLVTDGAAPLGGVTVTTTADGREIEVGTPTVGQVGRFVLPKLPTPATYVLTVAKEGFGTRTLVVDLGPGEARGDLEVALRGGVGTITGLVVDAAGRGLGGVTVLAGGTQSGLSTTTLTAGAVGSFALTGVADRGSVTLSFRRDGYTPVSSAVTVSAAGAAQPVRVVLRSDRGSVTGRVTEDGAGSAGVEVTATDGAEPRTTRSTSGGARGSGTYLLPDLPTGTYTVTATVADRVVATAVVEVRGGATAVADLPFGGR